MAGSALSPGAMSRQALTLKTRVANEMDCPSIGTSASSAEMADIGDCLRKRPLDRLLQLQDKLLLNQKMATVQQFLTAGWDSPIFAPFVDGGGLVPLDPLLAMQSAARQHFGSIALVAGVTTVESYRQTPYVHLPSGTVINFSVIHISKRRK